MHWEFKVNKTGMVPVIHILVRETDNKVSQIEFQAAVSAMRKIKQVMK